MLDQARHRALRGLVLALDGVVVAASVLGAAGLHAGLREHVAALKTPPPFHEFALVVYLALPLFLLLDVVFGLHRVFEEAWPRRELVARLVRLHLAAALGVTVLVFLTQATVNRSLVALFFGATFAGLYALKAAMVRWRRFQHASGQGRARLLLVGTPSQAMADFVGRASANALPPEFVGRLGAAGEHAGVPACVGSFDDLERVLHDGAVDQVLFYAPFDRPAVVRGALSVLERLGVPARFAIEPEPTLTVEPRVVDLWDRPFVSFEPAPRRSDALALKHGVDVLAAATGLVLLAPLLLLVSLAIVVTMGRPVFFSQERVGLNGRRFRMIKFRTMVPDAERRRDALLAQNEAGGPVFKVSGDPRVTPLGRFLRKTSIDELPQLFNVLTGAMSLVGPRPLPVGEQQQIVGGQRRRLTMKPGITGLWQVSGRSDVGFDEWMQLDLRYVDGWSLALDARILLRTIPTVLLGRGAR